MMMKIVRTPSWANSLCKSWASSTLSSSLSCPMNARTQKLQTSSSTTPIFRSVWTCLKILKVYRSWWTKETMSKMPRWRNWKTQSTPSAAPFMMILLFILWTPRRPSREAEDHAWSRSQRRRACSWERDPIMSSGPQRSTAKAWWKRTLETLMKRSVDPLMSMKKRIKQTQSRVQSTRTVSKC